MSETVVVVCHIVDFNIYTNIINHLEQNMTMTLKVNDEGDKTYLTVEMRKFQRHLMTLTLTGQKRTL